MRLTWIHSIANKGGALDFLFYKIKRFLKAPKNYLSLLETSGKIYIQNSTEYIKKSSSFFRLLKQKLSDVFNRSQLSLTGYWWRHHVAQLTNRSCFRL